MRVPWRPLRSHVKGECFIKFSLLLLIVVDVLLMNGNAHRSKMDVQNPALHVVRQNKDV